MPSKEEMEVARYVHSMKKVADPQAINAAVAINVNCSARDIGAGLSDKIHNAKELRAIRCNAKVARGNIFRTRYLGAGLAFRTSGESD